MRHLRIQISIKDRAWLAQKKKNGKLEDEIQRLRRRLLDELEKEKILEEELEKTKQERDRYKDLLFKKNSKSKSSECTEEEKKVQFIKAKHKKKRGGQPGHKGKGYKKPEQVDELERIYLRHCPDCNKKINRAESITTHTIQDIPDLDIIRYLVKKYEIENQWCPCCNKTVRAKPNGVLENSHYGINTLLFVMLEKYGSKSSYSAIQFSLEKLFGLKISQGSLAAMLHRARKILGIEYENILKEIQIAKVKHCDETSWRIEGINHWVWGLFTKKNAYYCVDQSRGKGVIETLLKNLEKDSVLVHDDYGAYQKLASYHQSCWAHLLRESHRLSEDKKASKELLRLHKRLKKIFDELSEIIKSDFDKTKRQKSFEKYEAIFQKIIKTQYKKSDTKKIQTRIKNQENNLITAILHNEVDLTNNLAERELRPLVITRKISGGSQSSQGALTHMVNMSVFRSFILQGKKLLPALKQALLLPATS
jgi:alpha-galactosidase/6-phospho-beta-glucosidase family protein